MAAINPCLTRSTDLCGELLVRLGVPVLDDYLQFVAARARPNGAIFAGVKVAVDRAGAKGLRRSPAPILTVSPAACGIPSIWRR